ncbi:MAG TPA: response regulator [Verrucomicrobiae bacterium]|nr:response regulator [Verrucomicrobiae bacterium]
MANVSPDEFVILLVDDREDDILLVRRAFSRAHVVNPVQTVKSGEEAVAYLQGEGKFSNRDEYPLPELILLDLKMPGMSGFDVLAWIREQPGLRTIRVVVLTASDHMRDVNRAYELGANSFLVKPVEFERFLDLANAINGYWLWMSKTPESERPPRAATQKA